MSAPIRRKTAMLASTLVLSLGLAATVQAAPPAHAAVMTGVRQAPDTELPAHAARGSGIEGQFNAAARSAAALRFTLADGRELKAKRQRHVQDARGATTWVGAFDGQPGSLAVLTTHQGVTTGFVSHGSDTFEIAPSRDGRTLMYRVDPDRLPQAEPVRLPPAMLGDSADASGFGLGGASPETAGGQVQDLLVVYTPAAKNRYGQAVIESMIVNAIAAANQAYINSQVNITLNLVSMREAPFSEGTSTGTTLDTLQANTTVRGWRDQHGADVVIGVGENTDACGMAWMMSSVSSGFAPYAYGMVASNCLSNHSLAHEVGHIQGNQHDRASSGSWGPGAYPYSYGFRRCMTDGTGFRTVMSYSCSGANRVTQFSNPAVNFLGWPTGISYESDPANSAENARSMNNTAATVAAFRGGSGGGTTLPAAPSSLTATAGSATSVTVRWTDNANNESGYRVERSSNGVEFSEVATLGAGVTSYVDNGLTAQTSYWYRARAYNSAGNSGYSNTGSVTTPNQAPVAPAVVAAVNNADGSAAVSWSAALGASNYEVLRQQWDSRKAIWKVGVTVATVPSTVLAISDVSGNGTFRYMVRALNAGGTSAYGGPSVVIVTGGPTNGKGNKDQPPGKKG